MTRIAVSGATGWVGSALIERLTRDEGNQVIALARRTPLRQIPGVAYQITGDLCGDHDWPSQTGPVDVVVHTAARVHVMRDRAPDPLAAFRAVNLEGTIALARRAAQAGARRFVFVSTIKVNGERTLPGAPFGPSDAPAPKDAYAVSKREAEDALWEFSRQIGMEIVVVRPPLVYGPGVGANFAVMMQCLARKIPLPLAAVRDNRRSLVAMDNLTDFLALCATHPAAANQTFLVSDGEDLSTADLLQRIAKAMRVQPRLFSIPYSWLRVGATLLGKQEILQRLCESLQIDAEAARARLNWTPPVGVDEGLRRVVAG